MSFTVGEPYHHHHLLHNCVRYGCHCTNSDLSTAPLSCFSIGWHCWSGLSEQQEYQGKVITFLRCLLLVLKSNAGWTFVGLFRVFAPKNKRTNKNLDNVQYILHLQCILTLSVQGWPYHWPHIRKHKHVIFPLPCWLHFSFPAVAAMCCEAVKSNVSIILSTLVSIFYSAIFSPI